MLVGLTYDLRDEYLAMGWSEHEVAEFDRADTIDAIADALRDLGHTPDRIGGASALMRRLSKGDRWDLVLNIAEGRFGTGREALVPALLDHHEIPYTFGDPLCCALTLDKPACKRILQTHDIPTPGFAVVADPAEASAVALPYPLFAKPSREGSSKGVGEDSVCRSPRDLARVCERLIREFDQPVLVEEYLPGTEVTVGLTGTGEDATVVGVLGVEMNIQAEVYSYDVKERCEDLVRYFLDTSPFAKEAEALALRAYRAVGCRDAGRVDVRADAEGRPKVIEVNALAGLHPSHSDLPIMSTLAGLSYTDLVRRIMTSAQLRLRAQTASTR